MELFKQFTDESRGVRRLGAAAVDLCHTALGESLAVHRTAGSPAERCLMSGLQLLWWVTTELEWPSCCELCCRLFRKACFAFCTTVVVWPPRGDFMEMDQPVSAFPHETFAGTLQVLWMATGSSG